MPQIVSADPCSLFTIGVNGEYETVCGHLLRLEGHEFAVFALAIQRPEITDEDAPRVVFGDGIDEKRPGGFYKYKPIILEFVQSLAGSDPDRTGPVLVNRIDSFVLDAGSF